MYSEHGLSDVYSFYIGKDSNRYFETHYMGFGNGIRQLQTPDGLMIDGSSGDVFDSKMIELGFVGESYNGSLLFSVYANYHLFTYHSECLHGWEGFKPYQEYHVRDLITNDVTITKNIYDNRKVISTQVSFVPFENQRR